MEVIPLSPALGAEIRGVDASRPIDDAAFAAILDAWHRNLVIVLRGAAALCRTRSGSPASPRAPKNLRNPSVIL